MHKQTPNRKRLLRALHVLRLADERLLAPLLLTQGFQRFALHQALKRLREAKLIRAIPKRVPLSRTLHITNPNVYLLSPKGAQELGLSTKEQNEVDNRYTNLLSSKQSYRLMHDLDISTVHAAFLRAQEAGLLRLSAWVQGDDTQVEANSEKRRPDFIYTLNGTYSVVGELDTGEERLQSDDKKRRTIEQKVNSYGRMDASRELGAFRVLFVVSPKVWIEEDTARSQNILDLCREIGHVGNHRLDFYQVTTLMQFQRALDDPKHVVEPVIRCAGLERRLSIAPPGDTLSEPTVARPPLPS